MRPELFTLPILGWPIRGYGLAIVIGFLLAAWLARREALRRGLPDVIYDLGVVMLLSGLVGGRVFYYVQFYEAEFAGADFTEIFKIWRGGLVFYGGAVAGAFGGLVYLWRRRLPLRELLDACAPFIPIAMGIGRLGCLLNGCCYGVRCGEGFLLGLAYPRGTDGASPAAFQEHLASGWISASASASLPVFPSPIYELSADLVLSLLLLWYLRGPSVRGSGLPVLFIGYGLARFQLEFLRGDNAPVWRGWTASQVVAAVTVLALLPIVAALWLGAGPPPAERSAEGGLEGH